MTDEQEEGRGATFPRAEQRPRSAHEVRSKFDGLGKVDMSTFDMAPKI